MLADTSVWIDHLSGRTTPQVVELQGQLRSSPAAIGDLVMMEVLKGLRESQARTIERQLARAKILAMAPQSVVLRSARNYRFLRDRGFTIRSNIDCLIATYCIQGGHTLLHSDRDFDPFEQHLGLQVWRSPA